MGKNSQIQWTDHTWNPWYGCRKVSPGCKYCYAERDMTRYRKDFKAVQRSKTQFNAPTKFKYEQGSKIFTCSWSDFFIEDADEWREEAWQIIKYTQSYTYQILTKRPERIHRCLPLDWGHGYQNVWLGVSVESNGQIERIKTLSEVPAKVRFLSAEPLLERLELNFNPIHEFGKLNYLDWVIIGGESGNNEGKFKYRNCELDWIEDLVFWCQKFDTPVFVKQLGTHLSKDLGLKDRHGGDINEWPEYLQIRQFPK